MHIVLAPHSWEVLRGFHDEMTTGRDYYANIYASQLDAEARWLAFGAVEKANSVELLVRPRLPKPNTVMELGAGTGAIISELQRRKFAANYIAVDFAGEACEYMRNHLHDVTVAQADIVTEHIPDKADVVLLSHVIEHLENPEQLLSAVADNVSFEWLVIECPLEDLPASRFKNLFRDRRQNLAGHVQFFTAASLRNLISRHFTIVDHRYYAPWCPHQVVSFIAEKDHLSSARRLIKWFTMAIGPRFMAPLWKRVWLGNYALLCKKK